MPLFIRLLLFLFITLTGCKDLGETLKAEDGEVFSGGETTVFRQDNKAFSQSLANIHLSKKQSHFAVGNSIFNRTWVAAPSTQKFHDGVGPLFNARSCEQCHFRDGRGQPPTSPKGKMFSMLMRLSIPGTDKYGFPKHDSLYGGQFQEESIFGVKPEGKTHITYEEIEGAYPDGTTYTLRKPQYSFTNLAYGEFPEDIQFSPRVSPAMIGLGLLEAIPEEDIIANVDSRDANQDDITGKANYVWDFTQKKMILGRFGWKAGQPTLEQQVAVAFNEDLGISSPLFPFQNDMEKQNLGNLPKGYLSTDKQENQFEIVADRIEKVVFYSRHLAVPARRNHDNPKVLNGKRLFNKINCVGCHIPSFTTGTIDDAPELSQQKIYPYTDMLLHNMGLGLADNRPEGKASGREWRTPPLWGIGLVKMVNKHTYFLHDGRARNLEEAILWHGGEATNITKKYMHLSKSERDDIIAFLESL